MNVETIVVGAFDSNCYVAWHNTQEAIVIDPGSDADTILEFLESNRLTVAAYYLTHGHMDHVCAMMDIRRKMPAPVAVHPDEIEWMYSKWNQIPPFYPVPRRPDEGELFLADSMELSHAGLHCRVIHTPGHTPGGVCFYFENEKTIFTGDTLFAGSIGRTDFPMSDPQLMRQSLSRLAKLPPDTVIYSGHGPASSIAEEKRSNYFLQRG